MMPTIKLNTSLTFQSLEALNSYYEGIFAPTSQNPDTKMMTRPSLVRMDIRMNIGDLAKQSGVNAKLIRHYESIGLIPKAARTPSGYRIYSDTDVHILKFVKRARRLGFSMHEIKKLIGLWRNKSRKSQDVKNLALNHIKELEKKIQELQEIVLTLRHLSRNCHGDTRPDCPIIESLEENK